jgi:predicted AAA+ superfamily ATPase
MQIKRNILAEIRDHLTKKEITLITGPRQVGKTTLMKQLMLELTGSGAKTLFLDLDFEPDKKHFSTQIALLDRIRLEFGDQKGYVFIDEIQRKEDAGIFLKGLYDRGLSVKLIVSGSGSIELKERIHESLAGRKQVFEVSPVTFKEMADFKADYKYSGNLADFLRIEPEKYQGILNDYLDFGGYPQVIIEQTLPGKQQKINEIVSSYLMRDIVNLLGLDQPESYVRLLRFVAAHAGRMTDYATMARESGLSVPTVKKYLYYAEKTFVIQPVTPYHTNKVKEISKSPVYYFTDPGFRNFLVDEFGNAHQKSDSGFLFQNLVFQTLRYQGINRAWTLHYWRTTDGAEVDFVIDKGSGILPVEVKFSALKSPMLTRSFRNFIEKYTPKEAWVVSPTYSDEILIGACQVKFVPFYSIPQL